MLSFSTENLDGLHGVKRVVDEALAFLAKNTVTVNDFAFRLILTEAMNNAVIHGNQQKSDSKVLCSVELDGKNLLLMIENEGEGFDWQNAVKKSRESNVESPLNEGGRGFVIYKLYGYDFSFDKNGRQVRLIKVLD